MADTQRLQPTKELPGGAWLPALLAVVLFGGAYALTLREIFEDWLLTQKEFNYYSHGPLVLLVAAIFGYLRLREGPLRVCRGGAASALGLVVLLGSLLFHVVCSYAEVRFASGFSIISALAGWVLYMWGWAGLRRFWFPIGILAFAVPLPEVAIATISADLKFFAAAKGVALTDRLGIPAVQPGGQGSYIYLTGGKQLIVGDVCSGLRSLISLLFFGAVYVYICKARSWRRLVLLFAVFPIAIAANIIRITATIITAHYTTAEFASGDFHEWMGLGLFIFAFLLMFGLERVLLLTQRGRDAAAAPATATTTATAKATRATGDSSSAGSAPATGAAGREVKS